MKDKQIWLVAGSQGLYGEETLQKVAMEAKEAAAYIENAKGNPCTVQWQETVKSPEEITALCQRANACPHCVGLIIWMHTFSPAKMWINGLSLLQKPLCHLHTQFYEKLPYDTIDMDYMNLHQSAHGDREAGYLHTRMRLPRKVVAGHFKDPKVLEGLFAFMRAAVAYHTGKTLKVARFGDNMREVAVTEGDKVEAQIKLGWSVNGYGLGDLTRLLAQVTPDEIDKQMAEYQQDYHMHTTDLAAVRYQAGLEVALEKFLTAGGFSAFTDTFENLEGLRQLPGLSAQNLMKKGYGFGAEGDWKHAALCAALKTMAQGLSGGTAFMEDYTYDLTPGKERVLGAHMLEVCPTLAAIGEKPRIEVHPLSIGGKEPPARLVFNGLSGEGLTASLVDMGDRLRMVILKVTLEKIPQDMPKLPVARVLWRCHPDLQTAAAAWIYAGGAHHTVLSTSLTVEMLTDYCRMADIETVIIDENTRLPAFERDLALSDLLYKFKGLR